MVKKVPSKAGDAVVEQLSPWATTTQPTRHKEDTSQPKNKHGITLPTSRCIYITITLVSLTTADSAGMVMLPLSSFLSPGLPHPIPQQDRCISWSIFKVVLKNPYSQSYGFSNSHVKM